MIEFDKVTRSYGDKVAVNELTLQIHPGEVFSLLGHNGAGKTTSIKMLVGLLRPSSGTVRVCNYDVSQTPCEAAQRLGYVPDQPYLYGKLSGREFLRFVGQMHGLPHELLEQRIEQQIEQFGLQAFIEELTESYSHGMKQRTVFASALLHAPEVLVVDEPMVGLDPQSIRLVKDLLRREADRGMCVLMSTHTLSAAEEISDRIGVMNHSRLVYSGSVSTLREKHPTETSSEEGASLEALYLSLLGPKSQDSLADN